MTWAVAAVAGATVVGSIISSNAAGKAAQTQADAANRGMDIQQANLEAQKPNYQPYMDLGTSALKDINANQSYFTNQMPVYGGIPSQYAPYKTFTNADLNAQMAPNYDFQLKQGQGAINQASNATGGFAGGNAQKALQDYSQNFAGNAYQNALSNYMGQQAQGFNQYTSQNQLNMAGQQLGFNEYQAQRGNILASLLGFTNVGQNAVSGMGNLATGTAQNIASLGVGGANAQAAGTIGQANAISSGVQSVGNAYMLSNLLGSKTGSSAVTQTPGANSVLGIGP